MKKQIKQQFRKLILLTATMISAISLVIILVFMSPNPIHTKNGFERKWLFYKPKTLFTTRKEDSITSVCGITKSNYYFQTKTAGKIILLDYRLKNKRVLLLPNPTNKWTGMSFKTIVDSPFVRVFAGNEPGIVVYNSISTKMDFYQFPPSVYTRAVTISNQTCIFRGFDKSFGKSTQIFIKGNPYQGSFKTKEIIVEKHNDGGISTDGLLHFDSLTNHVSYINFYTNQFLIMDTNLIILNKTHTIDTLKSSQTRTGLAQFENNNIYTNTGPSHIINRENCVFNGNLYNNSSVKADNESIDESNKNSVIDTYSLKDGSYIGSFYIPYYKGERLLRFQVFKKGIIAIYKSYVVTYEFDYANN